MPAWNKDMNLDDAFQSSCVWCYQELARKVGRTVYARYLKEMGYGNASPGNDVASFGLTARCGYRRGSRSTSS